MPSRLTYICQGFKLVSQLIYILNCIIFIVSVCLLSVFLLLPYLIAKSQVNILLASVILAYLCMVWSMITTANYKLPNCVLRPLHRRCIGMSQRWLFLYKIYTYADCVIFSARAKSERRRFLSILLSIFDGPFIWFFRRIC